MRRDELNKAVNDFNNETVDAILTIFSAITAKGQRKKVLANAEVQALIARYGLEISEDPDK